MGKKIPDSERALETSATDKPDRALALEIALRGVEEARKTASPSAIRRAEEYLAGLATTDGRVALGGAVLILQNTIERANEDGAHKIVIDGVARLAELSKLADFSAQDVDARAAQSEREKLALEYLESTGVIDRGLELPEAARLVAQFVIDDIRAREIARDERADAT